MKFAIIQTGGKQYLIKEGKSFVTEKISDKKEGETVLLEQVLLAADGENVTIGQPLIKEQPVQAKLISTGRGKKVTVIKYKAKTRYRVKRGHRQSFAKLLVEKI